jgi:chemotaxis protein MotB
MRLVAKAKMVRYPWLQERTADMRTPKYLAAEGGKQERWLVSYLDIVTILLILFVVLAAHGIQKASARTVPPRVAAPAAPAPAPVSPVLLAAKQRLELHGFAPKLEQRGLVISLPQTVLFASAEDTINSTALPIVTQIAEVLLDLPNKVMLVGHADAQPIHSHRFHNNWELSAARSLRLLELLTARYEVPEDRLSMASQGSYEPRSSNDTEDGRAANRRVEIVILADTPVAGSANPSEPLR